MNPDRIAIAVQAVRKGDLGAFGQLVETTQAMAYAVALQVLRHESEAGDVVQEAYLLAFRRLNELAVPEAFAGWLRRIVVTTSLNRRRQARSVWVPLETVPSPPVLDEHERRWSEQQQRLLARALLTLSNEERRLCELYHHGGFTTERLAQHEGIDPSAMRKRLQRIRDKLRKEIEMDEQRALAGHAVPADLPANIVELLARPRLVDLPDNPVGATQRMMLRAFPEFANIDLPEEIDLELAVKQLGGDAVYIERSRLQRVDGERVLRYDLSLPLLLSIRWNGAPQQLISAGKVYRRDELSALHLEAFHQLEVFAIGDRATCRTWEFAGRILDAIDRILPRSEVRLTPTDYPMCARAWSLDVSREGEWVEVMAWGEYADWVLRAVGADPERHIALGAGFGLERVAALRYAIDDIRKIASTSLPPP